MTVDSRTVHTVGQTINPTPAVPQAKIAGPRTALNPALAPTVAHVPVLVLIPILVLVPVLVQRSSSFRSSALSVFLCPGFLWAGAEARPEEHGRTRALLVGALERAVGPKVGIAE